MPTIFDIAKKAGVSITTVSRALNGYSDVSETTRQRIVQIAHELNYYPSAAARSLQGKKTNTVGFAPMLRDHVESEPFLKEFIGLLTLACFKHDLSLLATVTDHAEQAGAIYRELAGTGRVDGVIVADIKPHDERIDLIKTTGIPFVVFGRTTDYNSLGYALADVDGAAGMRAMANYLYSQGHRRIAYFTGPLNTSYALHRYSGYQEALSAHALTDGSEPGGPVVTDLQEYEETAHAVSSLLALPEGQRPTAIMASNDRLALHISRALEASGVQVGSGTGVGALPGGSRSTTGEGTGIAVTGFDDLPFAEYLQPPLTTIRQPMMAICNTLLDMLVLIMKGQEDVRPRHQSEGTLWIGPRQVLIQPELVIRESA